MVYSLIKGLSLLELISVVAILAILLSIGSPTFSDIITKQRLKGATDNVYSALQLARSEAIKRNKTISLNFHDGASDNWCYAISDAGPCDCTEKSDCKINNNTGKNLSGTEFNGISLTSKFSFTKHMSSFHPVRGTANSGSVTLQTDKYSTRIIVSSRGRIRVCSPDIGSYPSC